MVKILKKIVDHQNESLFVHIPFEIESYRNGFMNGRYAFIDFKVTTLSVKVILCGYNPLISIHVAEKVENQKPLALSFSKNINHQKYLTLISKTNNW